MAKYEPLLLTAEQAAAARLCEAVADSEAAGPFDDELSALVRDTLEYTELSDDELGCVAGGAAREPEHERVPEGAADKRQ